MARLCFKRLVVCLFELVFLNLQIFRSWLFYFIFYPIALLAHLLCTPPPIISEGQDQLFLFFFLSHLSFLWYGNCFFSSSSLPDLSLFRVVECFFWELNNPDAAQSKATLRVLLSHS